MAISPADPVDIYIEATGRLTSIDYDGLDDGPNALMFMRASAGAHIQVAPIARLKVGVSAPIAWNYYLDFQPIGIDVGVDIFPQPRENRRRR